MFASAESVQEVELLIGEDHILVVELVADNPPPVLVLALLDELLDLVCEVLLLGDLVEVLVVADVVLVLVLLGLQSPDPAQHPLVLAVI